MKGSLHTDVLMQAVLDKEIGLRTSRRVSHAFVIDAPPTRARSSSPTRRSIFTRRSTTRSTSQDANRARARLGIAIPTSRSLSAVETGEREDRVDDRRRGSVQDGRPAADPRAVLDGPLAFDTAVSAEAAAFKELSRPVAGRRTSSSVPDLSSRGTCSPKQLEYLGGRKWRGGARSESQSCSRAAPDSARARLASCAVAVLRAAAS